mgnify:CR=1 FL=1
MLAVMFRKRAVTHRLNIVCVLCACLLLTLGQTAGASCMPAEISATCGPADMLQGMTDRVLEEIRANPALLEDDDRVRKLAERLILPNIDFRVASQWVLGKHWRTATGPQRDAFVREFRSMLVNTYLRSLGKYRDNTIRILDARPGQPDGRAVVDAEVVQANGPLVKVLFRLHRKKNDWLVYDLVVEGISLVATHRSGFSSEIREKGLDSLIAHLVILNTGEPTAAGVPDR